MSGGGDVEFHIARNHDWAQLPDDIKESLGNSQKQYKKCIVNFSIKNQLQHRGNLIQYVYKDERQYYKEVLSYSHLHLLLYPYHLACQVVRGLRITPFQYYITIMESIMEQERSYDSLPNFTAADCLRLLGIGRNEYIDLMNQCRSGRKLFRKKNVRALLPPKPIDINIEPWWRVQLGCIVEDDVKMISDAELAIIDKIIDCGCKSLRAGDLDRNLVHALYKKGLIYLDVPIEDSDHIVVPPLKGFVMNRLLGDYFETLLYKVFVSIDEHTPVGELASILEVDSQSVKNAVSLYCRLGFAHKKVSELELTDLHLTWSKDDDEKQSRSLSPSGSKPVVRELNQVLGESELTSTGDETNQPARVKRICFLFDSTLTAFLMMGNLSPGLKSHAVTMFEVGKLSDESVDSFLLELEKVSCGAGEGEGEARRYFDHALILRDTIVFLRERLARGLDLVRCESLQSFEAETCARLLDKNYSMLVSMAPLSRVIRLGAKPPHLGPAAPEVNSVWFKLFLYHHAGCGPPSVLLAQGVRLKRLPTMFRNLDKVLVTTWGHDPDILPVTNILFTLNEALCHSAVLIQAYGILHGAETKLVPFPMREIADGSSFDWSKHPAIERLSKHVDLKHNCGYITMVNLGRSSRSNVASLNRTVDSWVKESQTEAHKEPAEPGKAARRPPHLDIACPKYDPSDMAQNWMILDCSFGIPLFHMETNRKICDAIVSAELWKPESLETLTKNSEELSASLLKFIEKYQETPPPSDPVSKHFSSSMQTAMPTRNLSFCDGNLTFWDGR